MTPRVIAFDYVKSSERLKALRESRGISHDILSAATGINRQSLIDYEAAARLGESTGKDKSAAIAGMNINSLYKLAEYFGVTTDYILGRFDSITANVSDAAICERTGLSPASLDNLRKFQFHMDGVNGVLSAGDYLPIILDAMAEYRAERNRVEALLNCSRENSRKKYIEYNDLSEDIKKFEYAFFQLSDYIRLALMNVSDFDNLRERLAARNIAIHGADKTINASSDEIAGIVEYKERQRRKKK